MTILVDDKTALLDQEAFADLPEYSCSIPTGTTIGKRWKRSDAYDGRRREGGPLFNSPLRWWLGEYTPHPEPETVGIKWRDLIVV